MTENSETIEFVADGMHCQSCENIIKKQLGSTPGVLSYDIDYASQKGWVRYDPSKTNKKEISRRIDEKGYCCKIRSKESVNVKNETIFSKYIKPAALMLGLVVIIFGAYQLVGDSLGASIMPELGGTTSLILLFVVGLLTGFHCIGMCGGFVLSYSSKGTSKTKPLRKSLHIGSHLQYGAGKMLSYTAIGALFGLIGSIFIFTPMIRGLAAVFAGAFLVLYGLRMINIFPPLRRLTIPTPKGFSKLNFSKSGPMKIGLLNGLMIACGPLQALYIYAAGTGSVIEGATALFAFGLGTLPILFGFGMFASYISKSMTHKILKVSGLIVLVLGIIMINRGLSLTGTGYDFNTFLAASELSGDNSATGNGIILENGYQVIEMEVNRYGWSPDKFILKKGVPVKWVINGKEINGCNNAIEVPQLGLKFDIKPGEQIIEFTPEKEGNIPFSCWMGMIPGVFVVKDNIDITDAETIQKELDNVELQSGSCGGSCGSSTCGAKSGGGCGCGRR
ncbi:MAG: sulfite exporter TauE/SafE family protein [Nanoarchaeota archaeon]|nr:sulfite exporter TauE/SafE family protein [Nanoarchaeota archaeon]